jgi:hypothetical protein
LTFGPGQRTHHPDRGAAAGLVQGCGVALLHSIEVAAPGTPVRLQESAAHAYERLRASPLRTLSRRPASARARAAHRAASNRAARGARLAPCRCGGAAPACSGGAHRQRVSPLTPTFSALPPPPHPPPPLPNHTHHAIPPKSPLHQAYLSRALQHLDEFAAAHPELPAAALSQRLKAAHGIDLGVSWVGVGRLAVNVYWCMLFLSRAEAGRFKVQDPGCCGSCRLRRPAPGAAARERPAPRAAAALPPRAGAAGARRARDARAAGVRG